MADVLAYKRTAGGDQASLDEPTVGSAELVPMSGHPLDSPESRDAHRRIMSWYYYERDRQASNRMEMAMDHDFYDGDQWAPDDIATLEGRQQMPLVYNEVAPMCDWVIGTERRNRVDWKILPRTEDDVQMADVKTKVVKFVADVNRTAFHRSRAFSDSVKGGIGWVDDGVRDDATQEPLYGRYEDWRNVIMDSSGLDLVGDDARYVFRWRWVDEDVAEMMFPDRKDKINAAVEDWADQLASSMDDETDWQTPMDDGGVARRHGSLNPLSAGSSAIDATRRRVKLIECQYRMPVATKVVGSGPMRGAMFDQRDVALVQALNMHGGTIIDKVSMRVHVAVLTESCLLANGPAIYRHNKFSLTPVVCYRRGRDRQWYGMVRRVRSIQQDLNKRASKALWLLNTNQLIADRDAFEDIESAREEAQNPQGVLLKKPGTEVTLRRDTDSATGQIQIMVMDAQSIQKIGGVTDENLGRKTNAISGEAIKARQMQGSVVTTEPFDNLRHAVQAQGEKQLSLVEQFYTEEKVIRLSGAQGQLDWARVNQPEVQPDGSVRWINDVTSSQADFIVSESDYAGSLRQVMFDSMQQIAQRLPPEIALKLMRMAFEFSDLPNKDEIVNEIRRMTGEQDPNAQMTPEEQQQAQEPAQQQAQMQMEAMQIQRESAMAAVDEQRGKAREVNAKAEKLMAEVEAMRAGIGSGAGSADQATEMQARLEQAVAQVQAQAADQIDQLTQKLAKVTSSNEAAILKVRTDADTAREVADIQRAGQVRVAEIQADNSKALGGLDKRLEDMARVAQELQGAVGKLESKVSEKTAPAAGPAPASPAAHVVVSTAPPPAKKVKIELVRDKDGKLIGATGEEVNNLGADGATKE